MAVHAQWSFWPSTRQENFKSNDYMTKNLIMDEARKQVSIYVCICVHIIKLFIN